MDDIERAFLAIKAKNEPLTNYYRYVNGPQPLRYSTERLEEAFEDIKTHFEINWCSVIVDATNDRLALSGFNIDVPAAQEFMSKTFEALQLQLEAQKIHKAALGYTQGYLLIWKNGEEIEAYYNDPRMCEVFYDPISPKKKIYAAKWFTTADPKVQEITLYYPDRIEHWQATGKPDTKISKWSAFQKQEPDEANPYGVIPVFEFYSEGEITRVLYLQDAVNKTFADMMVAGEFGAFVQRWVITQTDPADLKNSPGTVWWIPAAETEGQGSSVGQFTPTDLTKYLDAMDRLASAMFIITRTPKHYLVNAGANVSGEALIAMEAPFIKKVKWYQKRFDPFWKDAAQFICKLGGYEIPVEEILTVWEKSESTQPLTEAQTNQTMINTGIPLITILRRSGWSEAEITAMETDMKKAKEARQSVAQAVLDKLRNQDAQNNPQGTITPAQQPGTGDAIPTIPHTE
jgi:hypothetical protein